MIEIKNVSKVYPERPPIKELNNINMKVEKWEIFGIIGFSGAGKSTLIRCLNGLEEPTEGSVLIDGLNIMTLNEVELSKTRRKIGVIFQHFNLLSAKTVFDNIVMPLPRRKEETGFRTRYWN